MEHKNGEDAEKFEEMLMNISNPEYFEPQNYLTWISVSILLGNYEAGLEDFLLYSPTDSEKWYISQSGLSFLTYEDELRAEDDPLYDKGGYERGGKLGFEAKSKFWHTLLLDHPNASALFPYGRKR